LSLNYFPQDNLFFEVAGSHSSSRQFGENTQRRGLINVTLDVNRTLPDGRINPGFLKNYVDVFNYHSYRNYTIDQLRAQGVFVKESGRRTRPLALDPQEDRRGLRHF
jgi:hypothetical protein